jgi:hypothetical protein
VPQRIFLHPGYNHKSLTEDYAILVVDTPFNFTPEVGRLVTPPIVNVNEWLGRVWPMARKKDVAPIAKHKFL